MEGFLFNPYLFADCLHYDIKPLDNFHELLMVKVTCATDRNSKFLVA